MARRAIEPSTTAVQRSNRAESRTGFLKLRIGKPEKQAISCGQLSASFQLAFNTAVISAAGAGAGVPCGYHLWRGKEFLCINMPAAVLSRGDNEDFAG
jgi:hypothetical protein